MPRRDWRFRIQDISDAIDAISAYTAGMNFEQSAADRRTVDAVIRNFTTIGEATAAMPEDVLRANPQIPWADMRAMRNFVVHQYFAVSDKILWETAQRDLPGIVEPLRRLLESGNA